MSLPDKNENYKDVEYWDQRYANEDSYEWCKDFRFFKPLLHDAAPNKNLKILVIGCGNSNLSLDLYDDGYKFITNVDYSSVVITKMKAKYGHLMDYCVMDMRHLSFPRNHFDIVIEKGTLDVLFTSEKSVWNPSSEAQEDMDGTLSSIAHVMKPNGCFISVTFAEPFFRKPHYSKYWTNVQVKIFGDFFHYYFYTCRT